MNNRGSSLDCDSLDEMSSPEQATSTPTRSNGIARSAWSDYDTDSSDVDQNSTDDDKETRANSGHPLLLSRRELQRLESIMSTASMRSSGRDHDNDDMLDDFNEADDEMKEFALQYAKDIIAQSEVKVNEEDEGIDEEEVDNSTILEQIMQQQTEMSDEEVKREEALSDQDESPQFSTSITLPSKPASSNDSAIGRVENVEREWDEKTNSREDPEQEVFNTVVLGGGHGAEVVIPKTAGHAQLVVELPDAITAAFQNNSEAVTTDDGGSEVALQKENSDHHEVGGDLLGGNAFAGPLTGEHYPDVDMDHVKQMESNFSFDMKALQSAESTGSMPPVTLVLSGSDANDADISATGKSDADLTPTDTLDTSPNTDNASYSSTFVISQTGRDPLPTVQQNENEKLSAFASSVVTSALSDLSTRESHVTSADEVMIASTGAYDSVGSDSISNMSRHEEMSAIGDTLLEEDNYGEPTSSMRRDLNIHNDHSLYLSEVRVPLKPSANSEPDFMAPNDVETNLDLQVDKIEGNQSAMQQTSFVIPKAAPQVEHGLETTITFDVESMQDHLADDGSEDEARMLTKLDAIEFAATADAILPSEEEETETTPEPTVLDKDTDIEQVHASSHKEPADEVVNSLSSAQYFSKARMDSNFSLVSDETLVPKDVTKGSFEPESTMQVKVEADHTTTDTSLPEFNVLTRIEEGNETELLKHPSEKNTARSKTDDGIDFLGEISSSEKSELQIHNDRSTVDSPPFDSESSIFQSAAFENGEDPKPIEAGLQVELADEDLTSTLLAHPSPRGDNIEYLLETREDMRSSQDVKMEKAESSGFPDRTQLDEETLRKESDSAHQMEMSSSDLSYFDTEETTLSSKKDELKKDSTENVMNLVDFLGVQSSEPYNSLDQIQATESVFSHQTVPCPNQQTGADSEPYISSVENQQKTETEKLEIDFFRNDESITTAESNQNFLSTTEASLQESTVKEQVTNSMPAEENFESQSDSSKSAANASLAYDLEKAWLTTSLEKENEMVASQSSENDHDSDIQSFANINYNSLAQDDVTSNSCLSDTSVEKLMPQEGQVESVDDTTKPQHTEIGDERIHDTSEADALGEATLPTSAEVADGTSAMNDFQSAQAGIAMHQEGTQSLVALIPDNISSGNADNESLEKFGDTVIMPEESKQSSLRDSRVNPENLPELVPDVAPYSEQEASLGEVVVQPHLTADANMASEAENSPVFSSLKTEDAPSLIEDISPEAAVNLSSVGDPRFESFSDVNFDASSLGGAESESNANNESIFEIRHGDDWKDSEDSFSSQCYKINKTDERNSAGIITVGEDKLSALRESATKTNTVYDLETAEVRSATHHPEVNTLPDRDATGSPKPNSFEFVMHGQKNNKVSTEYTENVPKGENPELTSFANVNFNFSNADDVASGITPTNTTLASEQPQSPSVTNPMSFVEPQIDETRESKDYDLFSIGILPTNNAEAVTNDSQNLEANEVNDTYQKMNNPLISSTPGTVHDSDFADSQFQKDISILAPVNSEHMAEFENEKSDEVPHSFVNINYNFANPDNSELESRKSTLSNAFSSNDSGKIVSSDHKPSAEDIPSIWGEEPFDHNDDKKEVGCFADDFKNATIETLAGNTEPKDEAMLAGLAGKDSNLVKESVSDFDELSPALELSTAPKEADFLDTTVDVQENAVEMMTTSLLNTDQDAETTKPFAQADEPVSEAYKFSPDRKVEESFGNIENEQGGVVPTSKPLVPLGNSEEWKSSVAGQASSFDVEPCAFVSSGQEIQYDDDGIQFTAAQNDEFGGVPALKPATVDEVSSTSISTTEFFKENEIIEKRKEADVSHEDNEAKTDATSPMEILRDAPNYDASPADVDLLTPEHRELTIKGSMGGSIPSYISSESNVEDDLHSDFLDTDLDEKVTSQPQQQKTENAKSNDEISPMENLSDATNHYASPTNVERLTPGDVDLTIKSSMENSIPSYISSESDVEDDLHSDFPDTDLDEKLTTQETENSKSADDISVSHKDVEKNVLSINTSMGRSQSDFDVQKTVPPTFNVSEDSSFRELTHSEQLVEDINSSEDIDQSLSSQIPAKKVPALLEPANNDDQHVEQDLDELPNSRIEKVVSGQDEDGEPNTVNQVYGENQEKDFEPSSSIYGSIEPAGNNDDFTAEPLKNRDFEIGSAAENTNNQKNDDVEEPQNPLPSTLDMVQEPTAEDGFEEPLSERSIDGFAQNTSEISLQEELMRAMQDEDHESEGDKDNFDLQNLASEASAQFPQQEMKDSSHNTDVNVNFYPPSGATNGITQLQEVQEILVEDQTANKAFSTPIIDTGDVKIKEDSLTPVEETFEIITASNFNSEFSGTINDEGENSRSSENLEGLKKPHDNSLPIVPLAHEIVEDVIVESVIIANQTSDVESASFNTSILDECSTPDDKQQTAADLLTLGNKQDEASSDRHKDEADTVNSNDTVGFEASEHEKPNLNHQLQDIKNSAGQGYGQPSKNSALPFVLSNDDDDDGVEQPKSFITAQRQALNDSEKARPKYETCQSQEELSFNIEAELISPESEIVGRARAVSASSDEDVAEKDDKSVTVDQADETSGLAETEKKILHAESGMLEAGTSSSDISVFVDDPTTNDDQAATNMQADAPMARSSVAERSTPDSLDILANKLDDLPTPSIETKDIELPDSMLNAMIDTPDVEVPPARLELARDAVPTETTTGVATLAHNMDEASPQSDHEMSQTADIQEVAVDGQTLQLNMSFIAPYKDVFKHGGYTDNEHRQAILILSACEFPDKRTTPNYAQLMDQLFLYVYHSVQQLGAEEYAVIYLQGAASKSQQPALKWMKHCHDRLSRSLRKSIKSLYIVHPTFWTRTVIFWSKPFVSAKFARKLHLAHSLERLNRDISIGSVPIPTKVRVYDAQHPKSS